MSSPHLSRPRAGLAPGAALALSIAASPAFAGDLIASPYDPVWVNGFATTNISIDHDPGLTDEQNGDLLLAAIDALQPGDQLEVSDGTWSLNQLVNIGLIGTPSAPIRIVAQPGERPVLTRPNAAENVLNIGDPMTGSSSYLLLRGFEITGGADGIRLMDADHVWIDDNVIHDVGGVGIVANMPDVDVQRLTITRNEIYATGTVSGSGEGLKLGSVNGTPIVSQSVIALNHIHDTGGNQGDGIEIGQGSWGNVIAENDVHDTHYPAFLAYGTGGQPVNRIERNRFYRSDDVVVQVEAEADVFNNLIVDGLIGFYSQQISNGTSHIRLENNTIINSGRAVSLVNWNDKPGMFFLNNVCYSETAESVKWHFGDSGVTIAKNATFGILAGANPLPAQYVTGAGLSDFEEMAWDGSLMNARPTAGSVLDENGFATLAVTHGLLFDLNNQRRDSPPEIGCYERDSWGCHYGYGESGPAGQVPSIAVNSKPVLGTSNFVFFLKDGPPGEVAVLPWGLTPFQIPLDDGNLWLAPMDFIIGATGTQGSAFVNVPLPDAPALGGLNVYFQFIITSPWSPSGWAFTEGLELTLSVD